MSRTLLAGFRGADGHSLARALTVLLVVAGCLGAVHSGRLAADAANGIVICSADGAAIGASANPMLPTTQDHCIRCALGCTSNAPGVLAAGVSQPATVPPNVEVGRLARSSISLPMKRPLSAGPRGPPILT